MNKNNEHITPVSDYAKNRNLPADMTDDELEIIAGSKAALAKVGKITNYTLVPAGLLQLVMNCMERDGEVKPVRKEIFEELQTKSIPFSEVSRYWTL